MHLSMRKILLCSCLCFFACGCTAHVDLLVTADKKVIEKVIVIQNNDDLLKSNSSLESAMDNYKNSYSELLTKYKYKYSYQIGSEVSKGIIQKSYPSLEEYSKSYSYKSMYEEANIIKKKNSIRFEATGYNYFDIIFGEMDSLEEHSMVKEVKINIQFENKVIDCNADFIDATSNTYTWIFTPENYDKRIQFEVGNEVRDDIFEQSFMDKYGILIISISIVLCLFVSVSIYQRWKKKNQF